MTMRILHILDHSIPLHSGYTFRTRAILEQQRRMGWQTFHVTGPKHNLAAQVSAEEEEVDGLSFYRSHYQHKMMAKVPVLNQWWVVVELEKRLRQLIPKIKPDILHAHSPSLNGEAAIRVAKYFGLPVVYEIRAFWEDAAVDHGTNSEGGMRYRITRGMETNVIKKTQAVTTICEGLRQDIIARGVSSNKVTVIPNAVDINRFSAQTLLNTELCETLGLTDKVVLGFIGSFYAYEGLPLLIKALPQIVQANKNVRLLLVGGGPQESEIKRLVEQLGLSDFVVMQGRVPHDGVQDYYNLVDIFVYPRLSMRLTELVTPLKPLEAMAQRRLVLASDVGGHKELIEHGVNGFLFKADDKQALAEAVLKMLDDRSAWDKIVNAGRQFVEEQRNWPVSVANYQVVYDSLMTGRQVA